MDIDRQEAYAKDTGFYVDFDEDWCDGSDFWGVYGVDTGFQYASYLDHSEAIKKADEMTTIKKSENKA